MWLRTGYRQAPNPARIAGRALVCLFVLTTRPMLLIAGTGRLMFGAACNPLA